MQKLLQELCVLELNNSLFLLIFSVQFYKRKNFLEHGMVDYLLYLFACFFFLWEEVIDSASYCLSKLLDIQY